MAVRYRNRDGHIHTAPRRDPYLELRTGGSWELLDADTHGPAPWASSKSSDPADTPPPGGVDDVPEPLPSGPTAAPMSADAPTQADPADSDAAKQLADAPAKPKATAARSTWAAYATHHGVDTAGLTRDEIAARFA